MPFFVHQTTGELHLRTDEILEQVAKKVETNGIEAWFSLSKRELLGDEADLYEKVSSTMDVWFDSGTTHLSVLDGHSHLDKPADLYLEGSDQHRGWFQSSLLTGCAINNNSPYKALLTHGFVVDGDGKKMSKSMGNVVSPQKIVDTLGADILRLWVGATDYTGELTISHEILQRVVESYRRIRNTLRFLISNLEDFEVESDCVSFENFLEIDKYALRMAADFQDSVILDFEKYEFHYAIQKIQYFCSEDLGGFYLDILKDRLYTLPRDSGERRSAQSALYQITKSLIKLIAPVISFTAEEAWLSLSKNEKDSIFFHTWHKFPKKVLDCSLDWKIIRDVKTELQRAIEQERERGIIGSSLEAEVVVKAPPDQFAVLKKLEADLKYVFITSRVKLEKGTSLDRTRVLVSKSTNPKCQRCWHHSDQVGSIKDHLDICKRCFDSLSGKVEQRRYA